MKLSFAIIGCGRIARRHAEQISKIGRLVAVCDIVYENALEFSKAYNTTIYLSIEELLKNEPTVDVVSICTPNGLHAYHSILSLRAHKHVLCEKPLCTNSKDANEMLEAAKKANKQLYVVKQNRYNPPVEAVKKLLKEDKLGKIFSFQVNCFWNRPQQYYLNSWKGTKELDGGTLFTQFSHFIDIVYWFFGEVSMVRSILKNYAHPTLEFEDSGIIMLEMQTGATGCINYSVNTWQNNMEGSVTIIGEKGTVKIGGQYLNELEYFNVEGEETPELKKGNSSNAYGFYQGSMSNHDKVYENLLLALQNPQHEMASAIEGLKTVEIIENIYAQQKF